jgi:hypothetical protein
MIYYKIAISHVENMCTPGEYTSTLLFKYTEAEIRQLNARKTRSL